MANTIRDIIRLKSETLREVEKIGPQKASEELVNLSSLLSSLNAYISDKNYAYNVKYQDLLLEHTVAAKAKIHAEASLEWKELDAAKMQKEALKELIGSLKYYCRAAEEEKRISRFN